MVTLGLASYAEFEFRRKVGIYFKLPNILPSSHRLRFEAKLAKDPPLRRSSKVEELEDSAEPAGNPVEEVTKTSRLEQFIQKFYNPIASIATKLMRYLSTTGVEIFINLLFLIINYIHLIYLGNTFASHDLSVGETLVRYAQFNYISPILVCIVLSYAHLL